MTTDLIAILDPPTSAGRQSAYRPEIDGLRALAVVAVIINHFAKDTLPGGYLGVDIFFVISGYVITSSLANRSDRTLADLLLGFYTRRIKRLVPALALSVAVSGVLIRLFDPRPVASLRTGIASLFGFSNLYLLKQATDYFGASAELNMFTHTWSLGVEEQFYLLFPFLVWFTSFGRLTVNGPGNLARVVGALSVASLIAFIYLNHTDQPAAYFLMPIRLWELGAGCLLFLGLNTSNRFFRALQGISPLIVSAAVIAVLFFPSQFAAQATIAVVLLTALLITSLRPKTCAYALLASPPVVYTGLISYCLYLWHWPVLVLSRWTIGIHWWSVPIQVVSIFLPAAASYHYIETPLRRSEWPLLRWRGIGYGLSALSISAVLLLYLLFYGRFLYTGTKPTNPAVATAPMQTVSSRSVDRERGTLILIGDSHAGHFAELAKEAADELHMRSSVISEGATPFPIINISTPVGGLTFRKNQNSNAQVTKAVNLELGKISQSDDALILLSSFYRFYFETPAGSRKYQKLNYYRENGHPISSRESFNSWLEDLARFAHKYQRAQIVLLLSTPEMPNLYPEVLCRKEWFRKTISDNCSVSVPRSEMLDTLARLNREISERASRLANVVVFDPTISLCPPTTKVCNSQDGGNRLYSDEDHLTRYGSQKVKDQFMKFLKENNIVQRISAAPRLTMNRYLETR